MDEEPSCYFRVMTGYIISNAAYYGRDKEGTVGTVLCFWGGTILNNPNILGFCFCCLTSEVLKVHGQDWSCKVTPRQLIVSECQHYSTQIRGYIVIFHLGGCTVER